MLKIAFLGAGSHGFGPKLIGDIMSFESLADCELHLIDPHAERLAAVEGIAQRWVSEEKLPTRVSASTEREAGLDGADYVIASIRVGSEVEELDYRIPFEVGGLRQTVGDTVGVGGVLKGLRTVPPLLDVVHDMERLCPDALFLNYTNPMAIIMWALAEASSIQGVGLCHSVQNTANELSGYLGIARETLRFQVGGINHMAWFTQLTAGGEDLYPRLRERSEDPEIFAKDATRFEIFRQFGYFVTESTRHMTEYIPYVLRHDAEIERLKQSWTDEAALVKRRQWQADQLPSLQAKVTQESLGLRRSPEYAARILDAIETDTPTVIHGTVPNDGLIWNLLPGCACEVPCLVDGAGLHPTQFGALPPQCAGLCSSNVAMQQMVVKAVLERDPEAAIHAAMLDPNTAAQLPLPVIREVVTRLIEAEAAYMPF